MKLVLVGDVMLGRLVNEVLKHVPPEYPWGDTLPLLQEADVGICNLECVLADTGKPWSRTPKVFHFRTDEKNVAVLKTAGMDLVSLANNHVLDYEDQALFRMMKVLADHSISFAGSGANLWQACQPALYCSHEHTIGLVAFTDNEPDWQAREQTPGVFYVPTDADHPRAKLLFEGIEKAREQVDLLIVSAHWGPNTGSRPQPEHLPFAKQLIDHGADILFGHSCHVFQGIEIYEHRPILYSTGDFVDDYAVDPIERNDHSFLFVIETDDHTIVQLKLYPTVIRNMQASKATGEERQAIVFTMSRLCQELGTRALWQEAEECLQIPV